MHGFENDDVARSLSQVLANEVPHLCAVGSIEAARQEGEVFKNTSGISREQWPVV